MDGFPRPANDTGLGFAYFPDEDHYRPADLERWLPELRTLGASWVVLRALRPAPIPAAFVRELVNAQIEPVVHFYGTRLERLALPELRRTAERYAEWGVHYVCLYDRPNQREVWGGEWGRPQLVERFVDALLPGLQTLHEAGLVPVIAPPAPGGHYWDLTFLASLLASIRRRAPDGLCARLAVGMHNFADAHPLNWGAGGPGAWPAAQPYLTPSGSEDHVGFRLFEWYDAIARAQLGHSVPLISLGDGLRLGVAGVDRARHSSGHLAIADLLASGAVPSVVMNSAFWLLAAGPDDPEAAHAWYQDGRARTPAVGALRARGRRIRPRPASATQPLSAGPVRSSPVTPVTAATAGAAAAAAQYPPAGSPSAGANGAGLAGTAVAPAARAKAMNGTGKPLRHYVLLPVFEWGPSEWHWQAAQNYVAAYRASCGFSPEEAQLAEHVTIVGNQQGVSAEIEDGLRQAGCRVTRVAGSQGDETVTLLNNLARSARTG
jgi:hypothetical protein